MPDATLTDGTGRPAVLVRADPDGRVAAALTTTPGRATQDAHGRLVVRPGPGEWLLLGGDLPAEATVADVEALAGGEFATAVDLTHGVTRIRLTGAGAAAVLGTLCAVDLGDIGTPDGAALRTVVAGVTATVIRDDIDDVPSYVVLGDRSYGPYLTDTITDAIRS